MLFECVYPLFLNTLCRDLRDVRHVQDYMIHDVTGETVGRLPGTVDGEQLMVQNCHVCKKFFRDN